MVRAGIAALESAVGGPVRASALFATPAYPPGSGPDFVNAAAAFAWSGPAGDLLRILHKIEADFGRTRDRRWEARILDLDLLALGRNRLPDPATEEAWRTLPPDKAMSRSPDTLILPHPRMAERAFVLVPLADVAPDWRHPGTGQTVRQMRDALPAADLATIRPL